MPNSEIKIFQSLATLRCNKSWEIVYYLHDRACGKMVRKRMRINKFIKHFETKEEKLQAAQVILNQVNAQLKRPLEFVKQKKVYNSEKPIIKQQSKEKTKSKSMSLEDAFDLFLEDTKYREKIGDVRFDTLRSYEGNCKSILNICKKLKLKTDDINQLNNNFCRKILRYIVEKLELTNRTHNNYKRFFVTVFNWLHVRKHMDEKIFENLPTLRVSSKVRTYIPLEIREQITNYLKINSIGYYRLIKFMYHTFIRPKELTFLRIRDIDLRKRLITVRESFAKNHRTQSITIPDDLLDTILKMNLDRFNPDDFIFSGSDYLPGSKQLKRRKLTEDWSKMRKELHLDKKYQLYSVKDTGIEDLLIKGIPILEVQKQARHSDFRTTQKYVRNSVNDASMSIIKAKNSF